MSLACVCVCVCVEFETRQPPNNDNAAYQSSTVYQKEQIVFWLYLWRPGECDVVW